MTIETVSDYTGEGGRLIKAERVLIWTGDWVPMGSQRRGIAFESLDEERGMPITRLVVPEHDWRDMGSPDKVTVTIEPGDRLNQ